LFYLAKIFNIYFKLTNVGVENSIFLIVETKHISKRMLIMSDKELQKEITRI
jgi:hypothetical protein